VQYSREDKTLTVWYRAGGVYRYFDVSEYLYRRLLLNIDQPWTVLSEVVKKHQFKRITPRKIYARRRIYRVAKLKLTTHRREE
jgi:hypothetical protein